MKKIISFALAALTMLTMAAPALAKEKPAAMEQQVQSKYVAIIGTITEVNVKEKQVTVEKSDGEGLIVLNTDKNTAIVDNATRKPVKVKDLKVGTAVYAWHSNAVTRSLPPQSYAYVLTVNVKEGAAPGQFFEVEQIMKNKDGSFTLLNERQDLYMTIPGKMSIKRFGANSSYNVSAIKPGTRLIAWYDTMTLSYPAQTYTETLVLLPDAYDGYVGIFGTAIKANKKDVKAPAIKEEGNVLVPADQVAKALGFSVKYNRVAQTLTLKKSKTTVVFTLGQDTFTVNGSGIGTLTPAVVDGVIYVDLNAFAFMGNYKLANPVR